MRLPDADAAQSPELDAVYAKFRGTRGIVSNVIKSFGHAPAGLSVIVDLGTYCRYGTQLSELQRELVILITGRGVAYAWHHHAPLGLAAGLTPAQLEALREGRVPDGLAEAEAALCDYVLAYAALKGVPQPVFARLLACFTPRQVTDVNIIAGYYLCIASSIIAMEVQPEAAAVRDAGVSFHQQPKD
ncbi:carboxymuconolactone decarboxylase family protein [Falsiroseomonas sp. HW251]|uniref:carboxymuconolactone decarboxylase family protein n=1 Tax=Falsiroseomonas sp. HW251 TaxID=3390998 RepID=UPI003D31A4CC